jgi:hypothetical protein
MPDSSEDLRSTIDAVQRDAQQVQALEQEKAELDPSDPRVASLSARVERVATGLRDKAVAERELSEEAQSAG